jgi:hypothetical protein
MSIGVWVGLIALLGVDAETGVFMLLYLDLAYEKAKREGRLRSLADLQAAILEGAVKRLRPKFMTVATTFLGLIPIMWAVGTGADVMKRIAAPLVGGILRRSSLSWSCTPQFTRSGSGGRSGKGSRDNDQCPMTNDQWADGDGRVFLVIGIWSLVIHTKPKKEDWYEGHRHSHHGAGGAHRGGSHLLQLPA